MPKKIRELIREMRKPDSLNEAVAEGLFLGGCHGDDERAVFAELCEIGEETIELYHQDGKPLPPPTSGRDFANKMRDVA